MAKIFIFRGPTGCGKTYQAFNHLNSKKSAIYLAPCRQLVYESAMKYGTLNSEVVTSDLHMFKKGYDISFRTYEACKRSDLKKASTLIVDEAHFMRDPERGNHLVDLVYYMTKILNRKVILLSATMDFTVQGAKIINLPPRGETFIKTEVSFSEFKKRVLNEVPTLWFEGTRQGCYDTVEALEDQGVKAAAITADTSVNDRVTIVNNYNKGIISCIVATNAMAQGVNIPCENILINYNRRYDEPSVIIQKFGRLGRKGVTSANAELTYCLGDFLDQAEVKQLSKIFETPSKILRLTSKNRNHQVIDYDLRTPATIREINSLTNKIKRGWKKPL